MITDPTKNENPIAVFIQDVKNNANDLPGDLSDWLSDTLGIDTTETAQPEPTPQNTADKAVGWLQNPTNLIIAFFALILGWLILK